MITYDEKYAKVCGINVTFYQFLIALFTALVVVIGMRMMGTLLISSLIVFPVLSAKQIFKTYKSVVIASSIIPVICLMVGLGSNYYIDWPVGSTIVVVNLAVLIVFLITGKILYRNRK